MCIRSLAAGVYTTQAGLWDPRLRLDSPLQLPWWPRSACSLLWLPIAVYPSSVLTVHSLTTCIFFSTFICAQAAVSAWLAPHYSVWLPLPCLGHLDRSLRRLGFHCYRLLQLPSNPLPWGVHSLVCGLLGTGCRYSISSSIRLSSLGLCGCFLCATNPVCSTDNRPEGPLMQDKPYWGWGCWYCSITGGGGAGQTPSCPLTEWPALCLDQSQSFVWTNHTSQNQLPFFSETCASYQL